MLGFVFCELARLAKVYSVSFPNAKLQIVFDIVKYRPLLVVDNQFFEKCSSLQKKIKRHLFFEVKYR